MYDPESFCETREPVATGRTGRLNAVMAADLDRARCQLSDGVTRLMIQAQIGCPDAL